MPSSSRLDRISSIGVLFCAVVVAGLVTYRTFRPASTTSPSARAPERVDEAVWREIVDAGIFIGGDREAPVTMVEFTDLECPACRGYQATLEEVVAVRRESVRLLYVPFPLSYHRFAQPAAKAATCAADLGSLPAWIKAAYDGQPLLGVRSWGSFALAAGIRDTTRIARCANDTLPSEEIATGVRLGLKLGEIGTPTLVVDGTVYFEPPSKERLLSVIDAAAHGRTPTDSAFTLTGMVLDSATGTPLPDVTVSMLGPREAPIASASTDGSGQYILRAPNGRYRLRAERAGYRTLLGERAAELRPPLNPTLLYLAPQRASAR